MEMNQNNLYEDDCKLVSVIWQLSSVRQLDEFCLKNQLVAKLSGCLNFLEGGNVNRATMECPGRTTRR